MGLGEFWRERLRPSRQGTRWAHVLQTLVVYRLMAPGSEWRRHREWYERSAMGDLMGEDFGIAEKNTLYRCHDRLLRHKKALFRHLTERWSDLFNARYEILLYDLTSTYFECDPNQEPAASSRLRKFGYSRDKRPDCVQVVIALVVTCEGLPIAYEVLPGNTQDKTTLKDFLSRVEENYGKANRVWVMDRGIPTEEVLQQMRQSEPRIHYLVGTPRSWLGRFEQSLLQKDWKQLRPGIEVKLLSEGGETYVLAKSDDRVRKEKNMRLRRLRRLIEALKKLRESKRRYQRDTILIKLGEAKKEAGPRIFGLLDIEIAPKGAPTEKPPLSFRLNLKKYRQAYRREGRYLLRSTLSAENPEQLWRLYLQLTEIEQVFKEIKNDLSIRPIHHQRDDRIEAHIFISFLAYSLWVTLKRRLYPMAPGLTPAEVLSKMAAIQMLDVKLPTTDGRTVVLTRYTEPGEDQKLLLNRLHLELPPQPPPKSNPNNPSCSVDLWPTINDLRRNQAPVEKDGLSLTPALPDENNPITIPHEHVVSLNFEYDTGRWGFRSDLAASQGYGTQSDLFGAVAMPYLSLTENLQVVARYTYLHSSDHNGIRLALYDNRIESGRGDEYNEFYAGLNVYLYGHKLKFQTGINHTAMDDRVEDGGRYRGWGWTSALRISW